MQEIESTRVDESEGFVDHPSLSPDGRRIVYARILTDADGSATDASVLVADVDGGDPTALTPDGWEAGDPSWSPDGQRILFDREPTHYWFGGGKGSGENTFIYTMAPDGSQVTQLTDYGTDFDSAGSPSWTADGSQILFVDFALQAIGTPGHRRHGAGRHRPRVGRPLRRLLPVVPRPAADAMNAPDRAIRPLEPRSGGP